MSHPPTDNQKRRTELGKQLAQETLVKREQEIKSQNLTSKIIEYSTKETQHRFKLILEEEKFAAQPNYTNAQTIAQTQKDIDFLYTNSEELIDERIQLDRSTIKQLDLIRKLLSEITAITKVIIAERN
jgi:outer membrane PBP1 activator LpoA protein